jgi:hypothetical protein
MAADDDPRGFRPNRSRWAANREYFKPGADSDLLPRSSMGSPFASSVFSDFHLGQRTDKPLTSFASPRFEMLSKKKPAWFAKAQATVGSFTSSPE